ncbi:hypothetical protein Tco_0322833 [Tanacetum coccineum]
MKSKGSRPAKYSEITPEGNELILWGDLKIMMESSTEENDQDLKDVTVIYMLVERRYPLSKELLQRMLDLGLKVKEESTAALHLVRFIKQQLNEEHQELTSPEANGFWLSIHLVVYNEELAIPEQTATGKGISNPLMAGEKPLELELACCLWMTFGCEAVIGFVLTLDLTVCTPFDSRVEGAEFEVTGLDKAFVLSTLGRTEDFGKGVTE